MSDKRSQPDDWDENHVSPGWRQKITPEFVVGGSLGCVDEPTTFRADWSTDRRATGSIPEHEQSAFVRASLARSHDFEERYAALDLAVKHHVGVDQASEVIATAEAFLRWLDPVSAVPVVPQGLTVEPAGPNPSVSAADGTKTAAQPAGSDEGVMARIDRHAKVIQVAFPRVSVSFSEALHIADAIRLDDARVNGEHADCLKQAASTPQSPAEPELPPHLQAEVGDVVEFYDYAGDVNEGSVLGIDRGIDRNCRLKVAFRKSYLWVANENVIRIVRKASETGK